MKLFEHKSYYFTILKKINIDNNEFYIFNAPDCTKHTIPAKFYINYKSKIGSLIKCYIDKINCNGQIFIEPEHPYYKRHSIHDFLYKGKESRTTKQGINIDVITVVDKYGRVCTILPNNKFQKSEKYKPEKIQCKVERVKKSRLYLVNLDIVCH